MSEETAIADKLFKRYDLEEGAEKSSTVSPAGKFNPQKYENSKLCGSAIEYDYENDPDALYASKRPNLRVEHEKPEHRIILFLKAQGLSNVEIAKRTGYNHSWISQVLRQPWARSRLVRELQEAGKDAVQEVIKAAALDSVFTLISERDNEKAKPTERISAANSLLDRFLGKPTQHVESHSTVHEGVSEVGKLQAELAELEKETARFTSTN